MNGYGTSVLELMTKTDEKWWSWYHHWWHKLNKIPAQYGTSWWFLIPTGAATGNLSPSNNCLRWEGIHAAAIKGNPIFEITFNCKPFWCRSSDVLNSKVCPNLHCAACLDTCILRWLNMLPPFSEIHEETSYKRLFVITEKVFTYGMKRWFMVNFLLSNNK